MPSLTVVGTTNAGPLAGVDERGRLQSLDEGWSLDWWVGADDRWHLASDEAAVRQRMVEATPVVETAMRVPTGDAVATTFGARVGGLPDDLIAFDVVNDTTLPFALALVLTGRTRVVVDGARAVIDGTTEVRFGRSPSRWAAGDDLNAVREAVVGGGAGDAGGDGPAPTGRVLAVLFPVAHTTRLRSTLTVAAGRHEVSPTPARPPEGPVAEPSRPAAAAAPEADQVARGWRSQLDRGLALRLPDDRLSTAVALARAQVLLAAAGQFSEASVADLAHLIGALTHQGFGAESRALVAHLADRQRLNGTFGRGADAGPSTVAALQAFGDQWALTHDRHLAEALLGPVAKAAHRVGKARGVAPAGTVEVLATAAALLDGAGQPDAARVVATLPWTRPGAGTPEPAVTPLDRVLDPSNVADRSAAPDRAEPADDSRFAASACRLLRDVAVGLVHDRRSAGPDGGGAIALFSGFPATWLGQPVEVHDAPTPFGVLSCAVRWHGDRPALLWDRRPWDDAPADEPVVLTAPALDPAWLSLDQRGEALLAAPPPPDLEQSFS